MKRTNRNKNAKKGIALCLALALTVAGLTEWGGRAEAAAGENTGQTTDGTVSEGAVSGGVVTGSAAGTATPSASPTIDVSAYKPATPVVSVRGGSKRVRITWGKISGADGYYIYSRPSTSASFTRTATIADGSTVEYVKKSLTQNTTYYFRVSAYKKVGTEIVESGLSTAAAAKTASVAKTSKVAKKYKGKSLFTSSPAYKTYKKMKSKMNYSKSFAIPGMKNTNVAGFGCTTMIPQAICHAGSYLLISAYDDKGVDYSVIYVVSKSSKSYVTTIVLPNKAKVGGMAYDGTNVWISKGSSVASFPYSVITDAVNAGTAFTELTDYQTTCKVNTTAAYMGYYNDTLWVGAFSQSKSDMYGYRITNKETKPALSQAYTMQVPSKTQGITFNTDGTLILTRSYRVKKVKSGYISQIRTYMPVYANAGTSGKVLKNSVLATTKMPPKVEGVAVYGTYTYTLFSSSYYSSCKYPVDRVIALKTSKLV
ncbi:MAG: fibronectin type III domain-containing protein [Lachnospiraceae bacterium]|nr:fibronectin type III domain-containing protein [Lachnospiraceae bacterium]